MPRKLSTKTKRIPTNISIFRKNSTKRMYKPTLSSKTIVTLSPQVRRQIKRTNPKQKMPKALISFAKRSRP